MTVMTWPITAPAGAMPPENIMPSGPAYTMSATMQKTVATLVMRMLEDNEETRLSRSLASAAAAMRLNRTVAMDRPITPWGSE